ncbi:MAG: RagB/SusD family nutrient uptake outer membrane protein [Bacteroidales bacterium]|nr:RagB/SusD family nutrient uptake outer membrane protein [Bacteroidales bacterium]
MKKLYIAIAVVFASFCLSACQEWLDETKYTYNISTATFYNTESEANSAVVSVLDMMRSVHNANWFSSLEINTEHIYPKGVYQASGNYAGITNTTHLQRCGTNYQYLYRAIMRANTPLSRLPEATGMSQEKINAYMGELYFLRAFNYWNLVRTFGANPLRTEENMYEWDIPKSSVSDIYNLIESDLLKAIANCPDKARYYDTPCKNSAKALYAWVCLDLKKYDEAKRYAGEVINSGAYSLVQVSSGDEFAEKVFGEGLTTTSEEVFYIKTNMTDSKTWDYLSYTAHPQYKYDGVHTVCKTGYYTHYTDLDNPVIKNWSEKDLRRSLNIAHYAFSATTYGENTCLLLKYRAPNASGSKSQIDIPLLRYTDVLLTYAEACARTGDMNNAVEALNQIKRRAYGQDPAVADPELDYKAADYSNYDEFFYGALLIEERYETFNEAKHWFFEERHGKWEELVQANYRVACPWPRTDPTSIGKEITIAPMCHLWKIPVEEFNYNKALDEAKDQNPGYAN